MEEKTDGKSFTDGFVAKNVRYLAGSVFSFEFFWR